MDNEVIIKRQQISSHDTHKQKHTPIALILVGIGKKKSLFLSLSRAYLKDTKIFP